MPNVGADVVAGKGNIAAAGKAPAAKPTTVKGAAEPPAAVIAATPPGYCMETHVIDADFLSLSSFFILKCKKQKKKDGHRTCVMDSDFLSLYSFLHCEMRKNRRRKMVM
jgi:hypothetical protein